MEKLFSLLAPPPSFALPQSDEAQNMRKGDHKHAQIRHHEIECGECWTGTATKTLNPSSNQGKNQKNLDKAMAKLLKNYPPPQEK